jgi:hypothetical protein
MVMSFTAVGLVEGAVIQSSRAGCRFSRIRAEVTRRRSPPAERSAAARRKATTRRTEDDLPLYSFRSLLRDFATLVLNEAAVPSNPNYTSTC